MKEVGKKKAIRSNDAVSWLFTIPHFTQLYMLRSIAGFGALFNFYKGFLHSPDMQLCKFIEKEQRV